MAREMDLFQLALGLQHRWQVERVEFAGLLGWSSP